MEKDNKKLIYSICLLVSAIFSVHYVVAKLVLQAGVPPLVLASSRGMIGGLCLLIVFRRKINFTELKPYIPKIILIGFLGFCLNQYLFMYGLIQSTAFHAAILSNTIPVVTFVFSVILGTEIFNKKRFIGSLLAMILISKMLISQNSDSGQFLNIGNLLIFLNVVVFSLSFVLLKTLLIKKLPYEVLSGFFLFIGGSFLFTVCFQDFPKLFTYIGQGAAPASMMFFEIIISTALVYLLNNWATSKLDMSKVTYFIYFQPIFTALIAFILYQAVPDLTSVLVYLGIIITSLVVLKN